MSIHCSMVVFLLLLVTSTWLNMIQAMSCSGKARYKFTFKADWTEQSHPQDFPTAHRPHFSPVVGCTHNPTYTMWKPGGQTTLGLRLVAEYGTTSLLQAEITRETTLGAVLAQFKGSSISNTGSTILDIDVNNEHSLVSAVSMIAPSPDWIVGVHDLNLCNPTTGQWLDHVVRELYPYDAGTDSATTYVHTNMRTTPQQPIFRITYHTEGSFKGDKPINNFGTFTFVKVLTASDKSPAKETMQTPRPIQATASFLTTEHMPPPHTAPIGQEMPTRPTMKKTKGKVATGREPMHPHDGSTKSMMKQRDQIDQMTEKVGEGGITTMKPKMYEKNPNKTMMKKVGYQRGASDSDIAPTAVMSMVGGSKTMYIAMTTKQPMNNATTTEKSAASTSLLHSAHVLLMILFTYFVVGAV